MCGPKALQRALAIFTALFHQGVGASDVLAEMVGTTRSRVNFFMIKFRKLGCIDYNGALKIDNSLLNVVLRD